MRSELVSGLGAITVLVSLSSIFFITLFAVALTIARLSICIPTLAASVLNLVALATLISFTLLHSWRTYDNLGSKVEKRRTSVVALGVVPSLVAASTTAASLSWMKIRFEKMPKTMLGSPSPNLFLTGFIIWGLSVIAQIAFYLLLLSSLRNVTPKHQGIPKERLVESGSDMQEATRPNTALAVQPRLSRDEPLPSPTHSITPPETISSIRSSLSQVVRPMTSRTRLLGRQSYSPRQTRSSSLDTIYRAPMMQEDGFDSWDTSSVGPQVRRTVLRASSPSRVVALEPIPGSRSPSPGLALDGPFPLQTSDADSPDSTSSENRRSRSLHEAHIHPLFRTTSPTPPPTATPGTAVVLPRNSGVPLIRRTTFGARPHVVRLRSESLPSRPSPMIRSQSYDVNATRRSPSPPSGEVTPPSREMTPPIPDFILSADRRSSLVCYGKRKASFTATEEDRQRL
ncbi:MAG: hypothetical protein M1836_002383 [Candelina mexicana]|nr:MAG: hypothetical protein M1836_002383 [Candelina mexicana]